MDLELTDEQTWLSESIDTLLTRASVSAELVADAQEERRDRVWRELVSFGALSIGGEDGLGAVELCLIARALGAHLASVPFLGSAAARLALAPLAEDLDAGLAGLLAGEDAVALALQEPGSGWTLGRPATVLEPAGGHLELRGEKVAVEHLEDARLLAVLAGVDGQPALAIVGAAAPGIVTERRPSFDDTVPMFSVTFDAVGLGDSQHVAGSLAGVALERLRTVGSLLAAAEALGAASRALEEARRYAGERRQFGLPIASFQSLRHILADMYVRQASGWSTVLYAAAAFDDDAPEAGQSASIAKAFVSRGAREVVHGAMQVFGGIAFTAEHPAHRFLRRIVVREQQFGDAAHHERALGRALARRIADRRAALSQAAVL